MKFLFNFIYYTFVAGVMVIAILILTTLVPFPGNFKVKVVKSGSMEPYIKTGGIVVIKPSDSYKVNDVITFGEDTKTQIPTTHRIVKVEGEGGARTFTTKGDANDSNDPETTRLSEVRGKVVLTVPYLGYVLDFAKKPTGFFLLVGIPAVAIIFEEILKIFSEIKAMRRKKLQSETQQEQQ
jgi:signal peptidase